MAVDWTHPPDGFDSIAADLLSLRAAAGSPSYTDIGRLVAAQRTARGLPESERRMPRSTLYDAFRQGRRRMDSDAVTEIAVALGLPTADLPRWARRLQQARSAADGAAVVEVREQAPAPIDYFAGRITELEEVRAALAGGGRVWVTGLPGSGKSQLALNAAARAQKALFVDLRGDRAQAPTVQVEACQRALLQQLGQDTGPDLATPQRAERLALALAGSGTVIVLDDAPGLDHASAIIGDAPGVQLIVTSRIAPAALPPGWTHIRLGGMTAAEATDLLRAMAHGRGVEPPAVRELTALTDGLPLAIALVGARMATHPQWSLEEHVTLLERRLNQSRVDEPIRELLDVMTDALSAQCAHLLRAVSVLPATDFDHDALAALTQLDPEEVAAAVAQLVSRNLAAPRPGGRFVLHSLVRAHAQALAEDLDPPSEQQAAFARLAEHLTLRVWAAYAAITAADAGTIRPTTLDFPRLPWGVDEAIGWLSDNRTSILAVAMAAPLSGCPQYQLRISEGMSMWLNLAGHSGEGLRLHRAAMDTAAQLGDADGLAMASLDAGQLLLFSDDLDEALECFDRARDLARSSSTLSDPGLEGVLLNMGALVRVRRGQLHEAIAALERSVEIHRARSEGTRLLSALTNLAVALRRRGDWRRLAATLREADEVGQHHGLHHHHAYTLSNRVDYLLATSADLAEAEAAAQHNLDVATGLNSPYLQITAHTSKAQVDDRLGRHEEAKREIAEAIDQARQLGDPLCLAETLVVAARLNTFSARGAQAAAQLDEADALLSGTRDPWLVSELLYLRGELDPTRRRELWTEALVLAEESEDHRAGDIRQRLARLVERPDSSG